MDHLFHKNLLQEKHNLEWQLAQANLKIKNLEEQLNKARNQTMLSEEIGVNPGTTNPNVPPVPNPFPQKPPFTRPVPDGRESRPVPMPNPKPGPQTPSWFDDFLRGIRKRIKPLIKPLIMHENSEKIENIERNIAEFVYENRNFIFESMMHSNPNLFENRQMNSETATGILYAVMEDIMNDQDFILENYRVLGAPTLTEDAKMILAERAALGKIVKKIGKIISGFFGSPKPPPKIPAPPIKPGWKNPDVWDGPPGGGFNGPPIGGPS